jgi:hypothetical protein
MSSDICAAFHLPSYMLHTNLFALGLFHGQHHDDRAIVTPWLDAMNSAPNAAGWIERAQQSPRDVELLVYYEVTLASQKRDELSWYGRRAFDDLRVVAELAIRRQARSSQLDENELQRHFENRLHGMVELGTLTKSGRDPWPHWKPCLESLARKGIRSMTRLPVKWNPSIPLLPFICAQAVWACKDHLHRARKSRESEPLSPGREDPNGARPSFGPSPESRNPLSRLFFGRARREYLSAVNNHGFTNPHVGRPVGRSGRIESAARIRSAVSQLKQMADGARAPSNITIELRPTLAIEVPIGDTWTEINNFCQEPERRACLKEYADGWAEGLSVLQETLSPTGGED